MSNRILNLSVAALLLAPFSAGAPQTTAQPETKFEQASRSLDDELRDAVAELARLRGEIADEQVPLSKKLSELESQLSAARAEYQDASRLLETRTLDLGSLRTRIKAQEDEAQYLSNLLGDYMRELDAGMHIAERARYADALEQAQLALENTGLTDQEIVSALLALLPLSFERLEGAAGGERFAGSAVDADGVLHHGQFALIGPVALFRSDDGQLVGTVEQRVNSTEPTVYPFARPEDARAAGEVVATGRGELPLDPTLGSARKIEETHETLVEHVKKGGPVMIPILALAAAALFVALVKWIALSFVRKPSRRKLEVLLAAVASGDEAEVRSRAEAIRGPVGTMLRTGVEHIREPRELLEEVMYERVLTTRLKLQRMLPFVAISAAAAPLLGLLGTVTGIINTFKMITVFGSGDVKSLSGGISEALITTEFGLIVAIPSLLIHAFLSRKARGIVGRMESAAIAFANQVGLAGFESGSGAERPSEPGAKPAADPELVRAQIAEAIDDLLEERIATRIEELRPVSASSRTADEARAERAGHASVLVPHPSKRE